MAWELRMPRLDEDMEEGLVTRWLKREGEQVAQGEPIVVIETQKVTYEVPSPGAGVLRKVLAAEGAQIPINAVLVVIAAVDEELDMPRRPSETDVAAEIVATPAPSRLDDEADREQPRAGRLLATPVARKLAEQHGVALARIRGTGPRGSITKDDVLDFVKEAGGRRAERRVTLVGMRKTIAERMAESWRTRARTEHFMTADVTDFVRLREAEAARWEREHDVCPSINDLTIAAAAHALRLYSLVNSTVDDGAIVQWEAVHVSFAVALDDGLITPVVRHADERDVFDIAHETRRLAELVRASKHTAETLQGGTFTVTNLGMYGVEVFVPIINPPQSAILAVGAVAKAPVVRDDAIAIRSVMRLCLAFDHRVMDGVLGAKFLNAVKIALEDARALCCEAPSPRDTAEATKRWRRTS